MPVSHTKFNVLMFFTLGMYATYWSYRQWKAYAHSTGGKPWAWLRGAYWNLYSMSLFAKLDGELRERGHSMQWKPTARGMVCLLFPIILMLPGAFIGLGALETAPLKLLAWLTFLFAGAVWIPASAFSGAVTAANLLAGDPLGDTNRRLTRAHVPWIVLGTCWWLLMIAGGLLLLFVYLFVAGFRYQG